MKFASLASIALSALSGCVVAVAHPDPVQTAPATVVSDPTAPVFINPPGASAALPFSQAVRVGNFLYLSGMLGTDPATNQLAAGGIVPETRQALENIKRALEANGSSMDRVFKCTVFLADMKEWAAMNSVYVTFFPNHKPARSAFGATALALNARTEIECAGVVGM